MIQSKSKLRNLFDVAVKLLNLNPNIRQSARFCHDSHSNKMQMSKRVNGNLYLKPGYTSKRFQLRRDSGLIDSLIPRYASKQVVF